MKYHPLPASLFAYNRQRLAEQLPPGSLAIFHSNDLMPRSGDTFFPFRQNSDLYYLSGIDQPETILLLFPACPKKGFDEILFVRPTSERLARYEGEQLTPAKARRLSGVEKVLSTEKYEPILRELLLLSEQLYLNQEEHDRFRSPVLTRNQRMAQAVRQAYPAQTIKRSGPLLKALRMIKSVAEIDAIQQSVNITGQAFREVMQMLEPGVKENEVEACMTASFLRQGATGHAYDPIVASGGNTCVLHYTRNNAVCRDGDLLLMDFGAEYANYAADLTRTIPVNGRFAERQRAVYEAVLQVQKSSIQLLVPGTDLEEYHREVGRLVEAELLQLGLLDQQAIRQQDPKSPAYKRYFMHGTSHHLGLDVHDPGLRYEPVQAGMVFTCEPAIYIAEEKIGIRLENNILVSDKGPIDLTRNIPIEVEELEDWMNKA
ncbi:MAG: aminopeptidase P family protein [Bacteroidota bacterium]